MDDDLILAPDDPVMVRVARDVIEQVSRDGAQPVVLLGFLLHTDGSYELVLRTPPEEQVDEALKLLEARRSPSGQIPLAAEPAERVLALLRGAIGGQ